MLTSSFLFSLFTVKDFVYVIIEKFILTERFETFGIILEDVIPEFDDAIVVVYVAVEEYVSHVLEPSYQLWVLDDRVVHFIHLRVLNMNNYNLFGLFLFFSRPLVKNKHVFSLIITMGLDNVSLLVIFKNELCFKLAEFNLE